MASPARSATLGVIGLGYVGLPVAAATARSGFQTIGFDIDTEKIGQLNAAAPISVGSEQLVRQQRFAGTSNFSELKVIYDTMWIDCGDLPRTGNERAGAARRR
jgi:UDP-N-acetyl-D-mannosaminuronate dehydrogenase